jgi:transcriptional regulator with XRE-family HTH domain
MTPAQLRGWRNTRGLTQTQLAARLGVTLRGYARWERGERDIPALLPLALKGLEQSTPQAVVA